jgi:hypothetical protein
MEGMVFNMVKAGIITFHCADNFGAVLQTYALSKKIENMGVFSEIIDFNPSIIVEPYKIFPRIDYCIKNRGLKGTLKTYISRLKRRNEIKNKRNKFQDFRNKYMRISKIKFNKSKQLYDNPPKYDYYIAGSDQIWNPDFFSKIGNSYFLDFVKADCIRISYAASIAKENVEETSFGECLGYIKKFDYISVREKSGKTFLNKIINNNIFVTIDPTFLITKDEWLCITKLPNNKEKYIFVYDLTKNENIIRIANKISEMENLKIITYSDGLGYNNWLESFFSKSPTEFLGLIQNAEYVLTNSFHGLAFGIIFNKQFYCIPHNKTGSRMLDLLNDLNLSDRIINSSIDIKQNRKDIDYNKVNSMINIQVNNSLDFLRKALNINK